MESPEGMGEHQRLKQNAGSEDEHVLCLAQIEFANATDEQVGDALG